MDVPVAAAVTEPVPRPGDTARRFLGFAHRGGMADAPANSLAAFRLALSRGASALEADIALSPDGEPLLSHGPAGPAALPLSELFAACGTAFDLSLDLPERAIPAVVASAAAAGHDPRRLWLCGSPGHLDRWRGLAPQVRLISDARLRDVLPGRSAFLDMLRERGASALNLRRQRWTAGLVRRVHAAGLLAFAWDVQTAARLRAALAIGCDGVYCDHVDVLVSVLGELPADERDGQLPP